MPELYGSNSGERNQNAQRSGCTTIDVLQKVRKSTIQLCYMGKREKGKGIQGEKEFVGLANVSLQYSREVLGQ